MFGSTNNCTNLAEQTSDMQTVHTATFVSDYGKMWEINYTVENREVESINWIRIDGHHYEVKSVKREDTILRVVPIDLIEYSADDIADRETHHMID